MGSSLQGRFGDFRFGCVHRNDEVVFGQGFQNGQYSFQFLVHRDWVTARASAFAAYVDNLCSFVQHLLYSLDCLLGSEMPTSVTKGIGRRVKDSHYGRIANAELLSVELQFSNYGA